MRINFQIDPGLVEHYRARAPRILVGMNLEHGGTYYPSEEWLDFGGIVLGWWLMAFAKLRGGEEPQCLCFMDGPYELVVRTVEHMLVLRSDDNSIEWRVDVDEFEHELLRASELAIEAFREHGVAEVSDTLELGVRELRQLQASRSQ